MPLNTQPGLPLSCLFGGQGDCGVPHEQWAGQSASYPGGQSQWPFRGGGAAGRACMVPIGVPVWPPISCGSSFHATCALASVALPPSALSLNTKMPRVMSDSCSTGLPLYEATAQTVRPSLEMARPEWSCGRIGIPQWHKWWS